MVDVHTKNTLERYRELFETRYVTAHKSRFASFQITVVDRWIYRIFNPMWRLQLRLRIDSTRHKNCMSYASRDAKDVLQSLGITNAVIGCVSTHYTAIPNRIMSLHVFMFYLHGLTRLVVVQVRVSGGPVRADPLALPPRTITF